MAACVDIRGFGATYTQYSSADFYRTATSSYPTDLGYPTTAATDYLYPTDSSAAVTVTAQGSYITTKEEEAAIPSDMDLFLQRLFPKPKLHLKAISQTYQRPIRKQFTSLFFPVIINRRSRL